MPQLSAVVCFMSKSPAQNIGVLHYTCVCTLVLFMVCVCALMACICACAVQVRNSWGTYWGELGFFKVQRGVNALQIESGDCW